MISISITEDNLMTALRGFLLPILQCEIFQGQGNRASAPADPFVEMTTMFLEDLSTNKTVYADTGSSATSAIKNSRSIKWTVQLDFYGSSAMNQANLIAGLVRTDFACAAFAASGIDMAPLYATEPHQTTMISGEQQYEGRFTFDFVAQFNPVIATPMQYADQLHFGLAEVATTFPPED